MKKSRKISVITAAALTAAGIVISFAAMLAADFDFGKFSTDSLEERVYENLGEFHNIEIESNEFDLHILPSADGKCRVVSWESEKSENSVSVENDTLRIKSINNRKWYEHINITIGETRTVTVYLPEGSYGTLTAKTSSGNVRLSPGIVFESASLVSTSGNIIAENAKADILHLQSTSGNVKADGADAPSLTAESTSGDVRLININTVNVSASSISGNVLLENFTAKSKAQLETTSGDIRLKSFDADTYDLKTVSGNIKGTVKSPKNFDATSVSGSVNVPSAEDASRCTAKTSSGDIKITVE